MTKLVLAIFGIVVVLTGILLGIYFTQARPGKSVRGEAISFVSEKSGYSWEVNQDFLKVLEETVAPKLTDKTVLVLLSSGYKNTGDGAGFGELDPFVYTEWTASTNEEVLNVYLNEAVWKQIGETERNRTLSFYISDQLTRHFGITNISDAMSSLIESGQAIAIK
jgi:hypothetical protein